MRDQISGLFDGWIVTCGQTGATDKAHASFISQLQQLGYLKGDETADQFFRALTELAVEGACLVDDSGAQLPNPSWASVDAFTKLVVLLVKYYAAEPRSNLTRINLLNKVFGIVVRVLVWDYDTNQTGFKARAYFRLFMNWLVDLNAPDPVRAGLPTWTIRQNDGPNHPTAVQRAIRASNGPNHLGLCMPFRPWSPPTTRS